MSMLPSAPTTASSKAPVALGTRARSLLVSSYKVVGFFILIGLFVGVGSFASTHLFYLVHRAWVVPTVVSPSDPYVLTLQSRAIQESRTMSGLIGERLALEVRLRRAERLGRMERAFQAALPSALGNDAAASRATLEALAGMSSDLRDHMAAFTVRDEGAEEKALAGLRRELHARIITEERFFGETEKLRQMARNRFNLKEKSGDLSERIRQAGRYLEAHESADSSAGPSGYDGLSRRRQLALSVLESNSADADASAIRATIERLDDSIRQHETMLATLRAAPLLRANSEHLFLAFVPYENFDQVPPGSTLYSCYLGVLGCTLVGEVKGYLEGERLRRHPVYGHELRGQLVELSLYEPDVIRESVLHTQRPPLFL